MKLKKPMTVKSPTVKAASASGAAPAAEGAAPSRIADRFRLDAPDPKAKGGVGKKAAAWALTAGLLSLGAAGILVYTLWKHWEFLMPA